ncbi:MAG: hypothetical protein GXO89_13735 [Chlorobi bacterium]|nr:hypothetical protein [Chlorobiota bacterium]
MKKISLLVLLFVSGYLPAQTLTNNGASLTITNGSSLQINGDFENINGSVDNSGDMYVTGNWSSSTLSGFLLQGTTGTVTFNGTALQQIGGTSRTAFNNLTIGSNTELQFLSSVGGQLTLSGALLALNNNDMILGGSASIVGANSSNYIITNGSGRLKQYVANSNIYFPIGTLNSFLPIRLKNNGVLDTYGARVFEDVLSNGTIGSTIPEIDHCVNASWSLLENVSGGSDLSVTTYWTNANENASFDRTMAGIGHYTSGSWVAQAAQSSTGSPIHSVTRTGISNPGIFAVGDVNSPMAITLDLIIDLKAFLEGPFNGSSMNPSTSAGFLPLGQPYNVAPWNYAGTENVPAVPNANIVDWVLIELRDAANAGSANPSSIIAQQAGFVLNDGSVVSTDGISNMQFDGIVNQNLYVVVYHRNHLGIISANALIQSGGTYTYDFTTAAGQAFGSSPAQKEIASGVFGMFGGDLNSNGNIGPADKTTWTAQAGTSSYTTADANLDGEVDNRDKNDITLQNVGKGSYVPE